MSAAYATTLSRLSGRYHRMASSLTGDSQRSVLAVAKALDAAAIRWAESDGASDQGPTEFTAVPTAALDELRRRHDELVGSARVPSMTSTFLAAIDEATS